MRHIILLVVAAFAATARGQTDTPTAGPIDECGTLVQGAGCVLFEGGGGSYVVVEPGNFRFGDAVRVVGTLDPACATICEAADGCIRGATLYDPDVYPCGTRLPDLVPDLVSSLCSAAGAAIPVLTIAGLIYARRQARRR